VQWRRCSKNSGGGIAPAAIARLIAAGPRTVNAFSLPRSPAGGAPKGR